MSCFFASARSEATRSWWRPEKPDYMISPSPQIESLKLLGYTEAKAWSRSSGTSCQRGRNLVRRTQIHRKRLPVWTMLRFMADLDARKLHPATVRKYCLLQKQM